MTKQNIENKHDHSCQSCHTILEKLSSLTPDTLPQLIADLKQSLSPSKSKSTSTDSSTSTTQQKHVHPKTTQIQGGNSTQKTPPAPESPKPPVGHNNRSPNRGLRQSPTPRQRIQLEKTNTKNRFTALEDEESMEYGDSSSPPASPTPQHRGKSPPQTPKPQRANSKT